MILAPHPSNEILLDYAAGAIATASCGSIASHLAHCAACRAIVARYEAIGGVLLDELPPSRLPMGSLNRILSRIEAHEAKGRRKVAVPLRLR
jgi:putative transcriptional regulator